MADVNDFRPGDDTNVILRKILSRLGGGGITVMIDGSGSSGAVTISPSAGAVSDADAGTIVTGGVSQQMFAANASRRYFFFENVSSGDLWINFGAAATISQPSIKVVPNGSFVMESIFISNQAVNVIGATAGQAFTAKQG
jgi:hypothetical protein